MSDSDTIGLNYEWMQVVAGALAADAGAGTAATTTVDVSNSRDSSPILNNCCCAHVVNNQRKNTSIIDTLICSGLSAEDRQEFVKALELIPVEEKAAFVEAMNMVPHLVLKESNPSKFLRYFGMDNASAAAKQLTCYWNNRVSIFGLKRAFCEMSLTGDGTMDSDDVKAYSRRLHVLLPTKDVCGRNIIFVNRNLFSKLSSKLRFWCSFFTFTQISSGGCILLVVDSMDNPNSLDATFHTIRQIVANSFPIRFKKVHFFVSLTPTAGRGSR